MQKNTSRALWRNRDFLLLWAGQAVSSIGSQISAFALPLLAVVAALSGCAPLAGTEHEKKLFYVPLAPTSCAVYNTITAPPFWQARLFDKASSY